MPGVVRALARVAWPYEENLGCHGNDRIRVLKCPAAAATGNRDEAFPEREFDIHQIVLDTTLLHQTAEIEMTPLAVGIERTHRWLTARGAA